MPPIGDEQWQIGRDAALASANEPSLSRLGRGVLVEAERGDREAYETLRTAAFFYCEYAVARPRP